MTRDLAIEVCRVLDDAASGSEVLDALERVTVAVLSLHDRADQDELMETFIYNVRLRVLAMRGPEVVS